MNSMTWQQPRIPFQVLFNLTSFHLLDLFASFFLDAMVPPLQLLHLTQCTHTRSREVRVVLPLIKGRQSWPIVDSCHLVSIHTKDFSCPNESHFWSSAVLQGSFATTQSPTLPLWYNPLLQTCSPSNRCDNKSYNFYLSFTMYKALIKDSSPAWPVCFLS